MKESKVYKYETPNRLKELREEEERTQGEIAKAINIHQTTLSKYEKGTTDIPTEVLCKLADYYNTSIDYILWRTGEKKPYKKIN